MARERFQAVEDDDGLLYAPDGRRVYPFTEEEEIIMKNTNIEWCDHTWNPWRGCSKVSAGCKNCYADTLSNRNPGTLGVWGKNGTRVVASESMWKQPLKWNAEAAAQGVRKRVFCASLADVFEGRDTMPEESWVAVEMARARLMQLIADTPNLDWLLLTKRPENVVPMLEDLDRGARFFEILGNVWLGTSVEDQDAADKRIPELLKVPAKVRFLSCEPLLGTVDLNDLVELDGIAEVHIDCLECDVDLREDNFDGATISWVICGGESGPNARPMHPDWARGLRYQCEAASVPFLFKQWGEWAPDCLCDKKMPCEEIERPQSGVTGCMFRCGKKCAGRLLDGREWNEFPEVTR